MFVGIARLVLHIPSARSLKDRRRVVARLKERLRQHLPISVGEVGDVTHQQATLGIAMVHRTAAECRRVLESARQLSQSHADAMLIDVSGEVLPFAKGGQSLRGGVEGFLDGSPFFEQDEG